MILNIHGYQGSSKNTMFQILEELFPDQVLVSPQLNYDEASPFEIIKTLETKVSLCPEATESVHSDHRDETQLIVGTSLGGFFATSLWAKFKTVPTILFNPAFTPWTIQPIVERYSSKAEEYKSIHDEAHRNPGSIDNLHIILGNHDEVLGNVSDTIIFSLVEFCQRDEVSVNGIAIAKGLSKPINIRKIECGHSAVGDHIAIAQIKETIKTLASNGFSNSRAVRSKKGCYFGD